MGILDQYQKAREDKENQDKEIFTCPKCGKRMIDNTFQRGSRLAGEAHCTTVGCDYRIIF
jgi:transcription elongation factor Elf1